MEKIRAIKNKAAETYAGETEGQKEGAFRKRNDYLTVKKRRVGH